MTNHKCIYCDEEMEEKECSACDGTGEAEFDAYDVGIITTECPVCEGLRIIYVCPLCDYSTEGGY